MKSPPLPSRERERLEALETTHLLDTAPEADFDDIVAVAAHICRTPIAAITLIDSKRQWFKSYRGVDFRETSRDISFCGHTILEPEDVFEVPNTAADDRFHDNPLVTEGGIQFYAAAPLVTDDGHALGALCVIDRQPRHLDAEQRQALRALGRQVMAQIKLRQRTTELEMLNRELRAARDVAEEASSSRTRLLASVSHELRTPMNGVLGMATLLLTTNLDGEQRELSETIRTSSEQLLLLLNQLLDFARLEAETQVEIERRPVDLTASIDEAIELVSHDAATKGIDIQVYVDPAVPLLVSTDAGRLRQVLVNLVGNAVKFTASGGIQIELGPGVEPDLWQVAITDSGAGLPPDRIASLFRPFYRLAETAHKTPGTGLGLAICRRLVELMGGRIWAENVPGQGARFSFSLRAPRHSLLPTPPLSGIEVLVVSPSPLARRGLGSRLAWAGAHVVALDPDDGDALRADAARSLDLLFLDGPFTLASRTSRMTVRLTSQGQSPAATGEVTLFRPLRWRRLMRQVEHRLLPDSGPMVDPPSQGFDAYLARRMPLTILLAEDNLINQRVVTKMLERFGYQLDVVNDGEQAVDALRRRPYDLVLMDLQMPVLDGLSATRQLRRDGSRAWVVAMTASAFASDHEACLGAGMDDYLTKPLLVPELTQTLRRAAAAKQRQRLA